MRSETDSEMYNLDRRFLNTQSGHDYQKYIAITNKCNSHIKREKETMRKKNANESKANPKAFWKYVQEKTKVNTGISTLKQENEKLAETDSYKAETLNNFLANVFTRRCCRFAELGQLFKVRWRVIDRFEGHTKGCRERKK